MDPQNHYRRIKVTAQVEDVTQDGRYSSAEKTLAELTTTVRLGGEFDREAVGSLVTSIVGQLMIAFDDGEGVLAEPGFIPFETVPDDRS